MEDVMDDTRYCPRFISGRPHEDPEFYRKDSYWDGISHAIVVVSLEHNELAQKIVEESQKRGIEVKGNTPEIQKELDELIKNKSAA